MQPLFVVVSGIVRAWMRLMGWRVEITGAQHLPVAGPAILATNHVGYLDPLQIGWVVQQHGRVPRFLAKRELFDHALLGPVMRNLKQVPVDRGGAPGASLPLAEQRLHDGDWLVVFPEGTISTSFVPAQPRLGAARLALATGAPLIPVALWGAHRILTKHRPRNWQRNVVWSVRIGPAVDHGSQDDPVEVTERLWAAVRRLVEEAQAAYPQSPASGHDRWWVPRHRGGTAPSVEEAAAQRAREREARRARERGGDDLAGGELRP